MDVSGTKLRWCFHAFLSFPQISSAHLVINLSHATIPCESWDSCITMMSYDSDTYFPSAYDASDLLLDAAKGKKWYIQKNKRIKFGSDNGALNALKGAIDKELWMTKYCPHADQESAWRWIDRSPRTSALRLLLRCIWAIFNCQQRPGSNVAYDDSIYLAISIRLPLPDSKQNHRVYFDHSDDSPSQWGECFNLLQLIKPRLSLTGCHLFESGGGCKTFQKCE